MPTSRSALFVFLTLAALLLGGCAALQYREPFAVKLAGVEPLKGEGLELRMLLKLRVQNPNDLPLEYNGVSIRMDVQGKRFASGVSDVAGSIPRFGEAIVAIPVSIPLFDVARQAIDVFNNKSANKLPYEITGKIAGPTIIDLCFTTRGEFTLPPELFRNR